MANPYSVQIRGMVDDGTNIFVEMSIFDGNSTSESVYPVFPHGTTAATIKAYAKVIANNQPTLDYTLKALVNTKVCGD
jgi:hypothetical protein